MTLADSIRLGSMLGPQAFGTLYRPARDLVVPGDVLGLRRIPEAACAIGGALDAVGAFRRGEWLELNPATLWPVEAAIRARCPICPRGTRHVYSAIAIVMHLNDDHWWPRERIADWLDVVVSRHAHQVEALRA